MLQGLRDCVPELMPFCRMFDAGDSIHVWYDSEGVAHDIVSVEGGDLGCTDLIAGQSIKVGTLCLSISNDTLQIKYSTTEAGWELREAHAWEGCSLADMPQTRKGNPKLGNFPHNSGDITGQTSHTFSIPLSDALDCDGSGSLCGDSFYIVAHAVACVPATPSSLQAMTAKVASATWPLRVHDPGVAPPPCGRGYSSSAGHPVRPREDSSW